MQITRTIRGIPACIGITEMTTYILVLIFTNVYGAAMVSIDYESMDSCERAGYKFIDKAPGFFSSAKYICLEH